MNETLFGTQTPFPKTKVVLWVFALALLFRVAILLLNAYWDHTPMWGFLARTSLAMAWSDFGAHPLPEGFQATYDIGLKPALETWALNDRGLVFLFAIIDSIIGQVRYWHVQTFHLFVDALMVVPVIWLANRIAGQVGALVAGVSYALFLPQAQMAVSPDYNSWLGISMIVMTWLASNLVDTTRKSKYLLMLFLIVVVNFISNEFRSIVALFAFGAAGWLWLVSVGSHKRFLLPVSRWKPIAALAGAGIIVLILSASVNYIVRDEFSPVRSSFGHAFFTGVGQYPNPLGMRDDDSAPVNWYKRETGISDTNNTMDPAYNKWLSQRAREFIADYPVLYSSMVIRRALRILFPNMAFTLVTDLPSYTGSPRQRELVEKRRGLVAKHGWVSPTTWTNLVQIDPAYVLGIGFRVLLLIALPIGLFAAVWLAKSQGAAVFALLPLAYGIITLSPVYVTPPVVTGLHAAVLAVSASGLYLLWVYLKRRFGGRNEAP